jgi:TonB family protein
MNTNHSSARRTYEYQPTIIETRLLIERLAIQLAFLKSELKRSWLDFKSDPGTFLSRSSRDLVRRLKKLLLTPHAIAALVTAVITVALFVDGALWIEKAVPSGQVVDELNPEEIVMLNVGRTRDSNSESASGVNGPGRVGINRGTGEGSGALPKPAGGGGGGGNRNPTPEQAGELPPPSTIPAPIPVAPPTNPPALPVAGIDIDPALWKDLKAPVYGDPRSTSETPSKGPGEGEGIGTNKGTGVGEGDGAGFGRGHERNTGGGYGMNGCCGGGAGGGGGSGGLGTFWSNQVEQRARLIFKPEPQYTEEARRNQVSGTVMLRVIFSSSGEVVQIRAVRTLPFGLTERAIAAARQIKFTPAMKGGQPVSVHMQLEYNFNLY